jgi:rare lipoprotein A
MTGRFESKDCAVAGGWPFRVRRRQPATLLALVVWLVVWSAAPTVSSQAQIAQGPPRPAVVQQGWAMAYPDIDRPRRTASGETYEPGAMTAAHRTLPIGTSVELTSLLTGRSVIVRINDKGPYVPDRIVDISEAAARELGFGPQGGAVRLKVVSGRLTPDAKAAWRLEKDQPVSPRPRERDQTGEFTVQLGSFADETAARVVANNVEGAWIYQIRVEDKLYYRVNFGVFSTRNEAEQFRVRLASRGVDGFVKAVDEHEKRTVLE